MWHAWERGEKCTGFWWASPKENDHLKDQGVDETMGSKWTLVRLAGGCGADSPGSGYGPLAAPVNAVTNLQVLTPRSLLVR
jgi:hypothetical protein